MPPAGTAMAALRSWQCRPPLAGWLVGAYLAALAYGAAVALLSDLVVRVAQPYPCGASGARQRPRTVRPTHGCANSAPKTRPAAPPVPAGHIDLRSSEFYTSSAAGSIASLLFFVFILIPPNHVSEKLTNAFLFFLQKLKAR